MTLILNGTDNSATTPAVTGTDTDTGVYYPAANQVALATNGTLALIVDSSQRVGIGTSSPAYPIDVSGAIPARFTATSAVISPTYGGVIVARTAKAVNDGTGVAFNLNNSVDTLTEYAYIGSLIETNTSGSQNGAIIFAPSASNARTERARIDSGGNVMVNTTVPAQTASTNNVLTLKSAGVAAVWGVGPTTSFGTFYISNVGTGVALGQGSTSWGTVSDERLKDIIEPITDAVSKVSSLRSVIGKYKTDADDKRRSFLIAQDVQAVLPEAIDVGEDEEQMLSVKYTEVIPLLVAAIKEQQAIITALTDRITALEAK